MMCNYLLTIGKIGKMQTTNRSSSPLYTGSLTHSEQKFNIAQLLWKTGSICLSKTDMGIHSDESIAFLVHTQKIFIIFMASNFFFYNRIHQMDTIHNKHVLLYKMFIHLTNMTWSEWNQTQRHTYHKIQFILLFFFFCCTGAWTQGIHLEPLCQPYFCEVFFEIGSCELFPWTGFKLQSSWYLPLE
jgi:hypothetical protein